MSKETRAELGTYVGREIPEEGPICLTRQERRSVSKRVLAYLNNVPELGVVLLLTCWGGEPVYVCGGEDQTCSQDCIGMP